MKCAVRVVVAIPMPLDLQLDDVVRLRKPHPCGGYEWRVVRLGADIGLVCTTCGRRMLLPRRDLEKRMKQIVARAKPTEGRPKPEGGSE